MKNHNKITGIILSLCAIAALLTVSCFNAFAIGVTPITANEGKLTMWILVGLVVAAAAAGVITLLSIAKTKNNYCKSPLTHNIHCVCEFCLKI